MHWRNTKVHYGYIAQALHWVMALAFFALIIMAEVMMNMTTSPTNTFFGMGKFEVYGLHKSVGMVLLVLIMLRVLWKFSNPIPPILGHGIQKILAKIVHVGLYVVMVAFPVSGYIMSSAGGYGVKVFGWKLPDIFGENKDLAKIGHEVHEIAADAIYILIVLHVVGALYHHYVVKDETFIRMFWRGKTVHKQE